MTDKTAIRALQEPLLGGVKLRRTLTFLIAEIPGLDGVSPHPVDGFMKEPTEIDAILKPSPPGAPAARDVWTDADLAASAQRAGMRQVSCEAGFARVKDGERLILTTV